MEPTANHDAEYDSRCADQMTNCSSTAKPCPRLSSSNSWAPGLSRRQALGRSRGLRYRRSYLLWQVRHSFRPCHAVGVLVVRPLLLRGILECWLRRRLPRGGWNSARCTFRRAAPARLCGVRPALARHWAVRLVPVGEPHPIGGMDLSSCVPVPGQRGRNQSVRPRSQGDVQNAPLAGDGVLRVTGPSPGRRTGDPQHPHGAVLSEDNRLAPTPLEPRCPLRVHSG